MKNQNKTKPNQKPIQYLFIISLVFAAWKHERISVLSQLGVFVFIYYKYVPQTILESFVENWNTTNVDQILIQMCHFHMDNILSAELSFGNNAEIVYYICGIH